MKIKSILRNSVCLNAPRNKLQNPKIPKIPNTKLLKSRISNSRLSKFPKSEVRNSQIQKSQIPKSQIPELPNTKIEGSQTPKSILYIYKLQINRASGRYVRNDGNHTRQIRHKILLDNKQKASKLDFAIVSARRSVPKLCFLNHAP